MAIQPDERSTTAPTLDSTPLVTPPAEQHGDRANLERKKLEYEVKKLEIETSTVHQLTAVLPAITTLIAVCGLLLSFRSQQRQIESQRAQIDRESSLRQEDEFDKTLRLFSESAPRARVIAVTSLRRFWDDMNFRDRARSAVLLSISTERSPEVRQAILDLIVARADLATVGALAEQNRFIRRQMAEIAHHPTDPDLQHTIFTSLTDAKDSTLRAAYDDLGWNIEAIVRSLDTLRTIRGVNLSGVHLSRPVLYGKRNDNEGVGVADPVAIDSGVTLDGVDLDGASLAGMLIEGVRFSNTRLDSANLASTTFLHCSFDGKSSIHGFETYFHLYPVDAVDELVGTPLEGTWPAVWEESTISVERFEPAEHPFQSASYGELYFEFHQTTWNIREPALERVSHNGSIVQKQLFPTSGVRAALEYKPKT